MKRLTVLLTGGFAYAMFLGVFLYAVGFVGNFGVPTRLDGVAELPVGQALAINVGLLTLFALQHSLMARRWFKNWWVRLIPEALERSAYVACTNLVLMLLFWQWQPISGTIWELQGAWGRTVMYVLFACGWLTVLVTTFLINHFDLFGLRQVWLYYRGRPYTPLGFVTPGPYRIVRHPMYIGWLLAFWTTPTMTVAHLAFALVLTAYILTAIYFEERDLVHSLGRSYLDYQKTVPKLIPRFSAGRPDRTADVESPGKETIILTNDSTISLKTPLQ